MESPTVEDELLPFVSVVGRSSALDVISTAAEPTMTERKGGPGWYDCRKMSTVLRRDVRSLDCFAVAGCFKDRF